MGVQFPTERFGALALLLNPLEELLRLWLWSYFRLFHGTRWRGLHNIPRSGPCIVASNHVSFYDPGLIGTPIRRRMRFMAYHSYFQIPGVGALFRFVGAYPVDTSKADRSAYENSLRVLREEGDLIIIFPEGGRARAGAVNPIKPGAARIALASGAWVVPAVILGPERAWPYTVCVPRPFVPINVKFYRPFRVEPCNSKRERDEAIAQINRRIETLWRRRIRAHAHLQHRRGRPVTYWA
jgi:1-acyl-sn-glycerol-3-phosphate acyltransferase